MITSEPLRWGIVGTGKIARIMAGAIAESRSGELVAVASRSSARAAAFASEFPVRRTYGDYAGVVDDEQVDLVYVATNHPLHREWAVRTAEAGKHQLCEKPLGVTHEDAAAIVDAAKRNDVFLLEAFAYRSHPQTRRLIELLAGGTIGEIRMIDASFGYNAGPAPSNYLLVRELAGGSLLDVGCYTSSMAHLIAGVAHGAIVDPDEVVGVSRLGSTGVDLSATASLRFGAGPVARLASSIEADLENVVRIHGSEGRITVPSPWLPGRIGSSAEIVLERRGEDTGVIEIPLEEDLYTTEVDAVAGFVAAGERSPAVMPWEESLANMRTLDRWRASIGLRYPSDPDTAPEE